jgi:hypothetical protein
MQPITRPRRALIIAVIAIFLGNSLLSIVLTNIAGIGNLLTQGVRFALTVGLCVMLYQGRNWARLLAAGLAGLTTIMSVFSGLGLLATTGNVAGIISTMSLSYRVRLSYIGKSLLMH